MEKRPVRAENLFDLLEALEPKPIWDFVPTDAKEQKELFLDNQIRNPSHTYDRLVELDLDASDKEFIYLKQQFINDPRLSPRHLEAYTGLVSNYQTKNELLRSARAFNVSAGAEKAIWSERFKRANEDLYGMPDEKVFKSLLFETKKTFESMQPSESVNSILNEWIALIPDGINYIERFTPSNNTLEQAGKTVEVFYAGLLRHVPEREEKFSPNEIVEIFDSIIREEFGSAAEGWSVELYDSTSINVVAGEKQIRVPENRNSVSTLELKKLVVHEIGVHVLRSIMGNNLDVKPLRVGLADYTDSEEGLAMVMEQAFSGKYEDSGVPYYLIASMAHFEGKDFRDCFEFQWRYNFLSKKSTPKDSIATSSAIEKAKDTAYRQVFRIFRGTDALPFFKDLAYYNGSIKMWEYMENYGSELSTLLLAYMGKADPTNEQQRSILYASKSYVGEVDG